MLSSLHFQLRQAASSIGSLLALANKTRKRMPYTSTFRHRSSSVLADSSSRRADAFLDIVKERRSHYALTKELTISKDRFQEIVKTALEWCPSPFNAQGTRIVVLFDDHHIKFWDIITEVFKAIASPEAWARTAQRVANFQQGSATVLFFEDQQVVQALEQKYAMSADKMSGLITQANAMAQFAVWTALEAEGLGGNLQHYNPMVKDKVAVQFNIPQHWRLSAELVVGGRGGELEPKEFMAIEERYLVFGA